MDTDKFKAILAESRNGCNHFVRHPLAPHFHYSDGVQDLAGTGLYWLLDILATELPKVYRKHGQYHGIVSVVSKDGKATLSLSFSDEEKRKPWTRRIDWTDLPDGEFQLELADEGERFALILLTEH